MSFSNLTYEVSDFVAKITLNRPPVNALNRALVLELSEAVTRTVSDVRARKVRVLIITGQGKYFCAGADLKERQQMSEEEVAPTVAAIGDCTRAIANVPVPVLAALQGGAFGGGLEIALAADIRFMASGIQVGLRETALAIIPGAGGTQRLTRIAGLGRALLWITSAHLFSSEQALQHGVADYVMAADELLSQAEQFALEIAGNGPLAVQQAKKAIVSGANLSMEDGLKIETECSRALIATKDRREGLAAFHEKRAPVYRGE